MTWVWSRRWNQDPSCGGILPEYQDHYTRRSGDCRGFFEILNEFLKKIKNLVDTKRF